MSTKTAMMGLKVTYNFDDDQVFLSKSNANMKVKFGEMELLNNETRLIGVVKLRACIEAVLRSSPEIVPNLAQRYDYNIYVCDYSEINTPLVGYGLLSKLISNDYTDSSDDEGSHNSNNQNNNTTNSNNSSSGSKARDILIPGKVETNIMSLLTDNKSKQVLSVKLQFKRIERQKVRISSKSSTKNNNAASTGNGNSSYTRKLIKPSRNGMKPSKRTTNPGPAPKAMRTLSLPVKPMSMGQPQTQSMAGMSNFVPSPNQNLYFTYEAYINSNNNNYLKRKSQAGLDSDDLLGRKSKKSSPLIQNYQTFHNFSDQNYMDQSPQFMSTPSRDIQGQHAEGNSSFTSPSIVQQPDNKTNKTQQQQQQRQQQLPVKKNQKNYWIIKDDVNNNKENIPPELLSELSDVSSLSMLSHPSHSTTAHTSAPTSDNSADDNASGTHKKFTDMLQVNKELDELLNFNPENFLTNVYNNNGHLGMAQNTSTIGNGFAISDSNNASSSSNATTTGQVVNSGSSKQNEKNLTHLAIVNNTSAAVNNSTETSLTPEENSTPKDSDALTPIIESVSDKEDSPSKDGDKEDELDDEEEDTNTGYNGQHANAKRGNVGLVSSPFTVYD